MQLLHVFYRAMHAHQLAALAQVAQQAAKEQADLIALLAQTAKDVSASEADPYLITGVLIEAVAHTLSAGIPAELQGATARAAVALLADRLYAAGLI